MVSLMGSTAVAYLAITVEPINDNMIILRLRAEGFLPLISMRIL